MKTDQLLSSIKHSVIELEPSATIVLFGSFARGDSHKESDIDLLILVDKNPLSYNDQKRIKSPLYDLEFDTGQIISPIIVNRKEWQTKHKVTPFYENIEKEGVVL